MKKNITFTLLMLLLAVVSVQASPRDEWPYNQHQKKTTELKLGVTAGLNITQMHYSEVPERIKSQANNKAGVLVGPTLLFTLPKIGLGADLSAHFDYRYATISDVGIKTLSVQIPLNLRYGIDIDDLNIFPSGEQRIADLV